MYSLTITRIRTDANTALYNLQKSEAYINYHNETYANTTTTQSAHFSDDGLTHTVIRLAEDNGVLANFIAEFSNTSSPMYESVIYEKENGITLSFSDITEVVDTENT